MADYLKLSQLQLEEEKCGVLIKISEIKGEIIAKSKKLNDSQRAFHSGTGKSLPAWEFNSINAEIAILKEQEAEQRVLIEIINNRIHYMTMTKVKVNILADYLINNKIVTSKQIYDAITFLNIKK